MLATIAVTLAVCAARSGSAERPVVGPPEALCTLGGLEACCFVDDSALEGPTIVCSRFDEASFSWELLQVPLDGGEPTVIGYGRDPDARGSLVAWVGTEPGDEGIWLRDLASDEPPERITDSLEMMDPSIAPDGDSVACTRRTNRRDGIWVFRSGKTDRLAYRNERDPAWAPEGELLLAIKTDQLWLIRAPRWEELEETRLTDGGMVHFDPAWGPDGRWAAFAGGWTEASARIGLMHIQTREIMWPVPAIVGAHSPAISPDGTTLAFVAGEGAESVLYVCELQLP